MLRSNSKSLGNPCSRFYILRSVQDSKVGDTVSTFVVKYSMLQFFFAKFCNASSCLSSSNFTDCFQSLNI